MARCNKRLGQLQKVCCIRMRGHEGLHRSRWRGLGGKHVTEWANDGEGNNGAGSSHLVLYSRLELLKGHEDGRQIP